MREISHTNPYTGETLGQMFSRGPTVAADGGRADANANAAPADEQTMSDVSHTPPNDSEGANRVFERGRNVPVDVEDEE
ncbi:hypothetical protein QQ977_00395 [Natrialbaceae archaeon AArc-T1-2]|nr:hypothetical protein [Natrialbaceae archaeon AArc-T1-2]WIV68687.1 hypothetical protein QQ977_00395 [Natrialbaceae archaeon AArc-T1-2]